MALGTTNITMSAIRDILGEQPLPGDNWLRLSELCLSTKINKWSKHKPVRGTFPQGADGKYGLDLANSWGYLRPRGIAYSEGYRMGDFRGYEHNISLAFPSVQCRQSDCTLRTIYPVGNTNYYNTWRVRFFKDASDVMITPADLGLGAYYFGLKITVAGVTHYKTYGSVASVGSDGVQFTVDASLNDPEAEAFVDLPYGSGTYTWELILCSTAASSWTTTAPGTVIRFPGETLPGYTLISSGSFTVANWIVVADTSMEFENGSLTPLEWLSAKILYTSGGAFTVANNISAWCEFEIWDESDRTSPTANDYTDHPENWTTGMFIHIKPGINYGSARSGTITISANGASTSINVSQAAPYVVPTVVFHANWVSPADGALLSTSYSFLSDYSQISFSFTPDNFSATAKTMYIAAYRGGDEKVEISKSARDGYVTTDVLTLGEYAPSGSTYHIYASDVPIEIIPE